MTDPRPVYAIADVHGRSDLLESVISFAESDAAARGRAPRFIFLGDLVDRGHDSRGCIELVLAALERHPGSAAIRGNHDDWYLQDLGREEPRPESFLDWLYFGGLETLASYGYGEYEDVRLLVRRDHPGHIELFRKAPLMVEDGPFVYVHGGIRPGVDLDAQDPHDLMWIRNDFLYHKGRLPRPVVHGHTIFEKGPIVTDNRISLDTGAYRTGRLTTLVVDPVECSLSFRQTDGTAARVVPVEPFVHDRGHGTLLDDVPGLFESSKPTMAPAA